MSISRSNKDADGTDTPGTGFSTNTSVAYQNGKLYTLLIDTRIGGALVSGVTGGGLTWVEVGHIARSNGVTSVFCAMASSGASTGVLSISLASSTAALWVIDEFDGMSAAGLADNGLSSLESIATDIGNNAAPTVALSAFGDATNDMTYLGISTSGTPGNISPEAGYTLVQTTNSRRRPVVAVLKHKPVMTLTRQLHYHRVHDGE